MYWSEKREEWIEEKNNNKQTGVSVAAVLTGEPRDGDAAQAGTLATLSTRDHLVHSHINIFVNWTFEVRLTIESEQLWRVDQQITVSVVSSCPLVFDVHDDVGGEEVCSWVQETVANAWGSVPSVKVDGFVDGMDLCVVGLSPIVTGVAIIGRRVPNVKRSAPRVIGQGHLNMRAHSLRVEGEFEDAPAIALSVARETRGPSDPLEAVIGGHWPCHRSSPQVHAHLLSKGEGEPTHT